MKEFLQELKDKDFDGINFYLNEEEDLEDLEDVEDVDLEDEDDD